MSISARDAILTRIRSVTGTKSDTPTAKPEQRMAEFPQLIRPVLGSDLEARFAEKLALGGGSLSQVDGYQQAVAEIKRFVDEAQLPHRLKLAPALSELDWGEDFEINYGTTEGDDLVSVTPAMCAIAETGSVVLVSGKNSPTALNFLPDLHIVLVESSQLVAHIEDAWVKLREDDIIPRTINIITGPSKTADVEQTLQIGAHGPRKLHIIWIT